MATGDSLSSGSPGEAPGPSRPRGRLADLWQFPLLLLSVGLFAYAAYLFIDPHAGPTLEQRISLSRDYVRQERPEAALALLNQILGASNLTLDQQARVHILIAEALDVGQKQLRQKIPINYVNMIEQTNQALALGIAPDSKIYRRLGEAYEALGRPTEALAAYRRAMSLDASHALALQRKVIDLQLAQADHSPASATLDDYLKSPGLTDAERSWAMCQKAQLLFDSGRAVEARVLLDSAQKLTNDPLALGTIDFWLGRCAMKLSDTAEAERYLRISRELLKVQHPLDADACYWLGMILSDRGDTAGAQSFFDELLLSHIDSPLVPLARMGRGLCRLANRDDATGLADLHDMVNEIAAKPARTKYTADAVNGLQRASSMLADRQNFEGSLEALADEQTLVPEPGADFYGRLAAVFEARGDQAANAAVDLPEARRIRGEQTARDARRQGAEAYIALSRKLTLTDDRAYGAALWHGVDLFDRAGDTQGMISALELFLAERPDDPLAPDALLRLGRAFQSLGELDKAIAAYQNGQFRHPNTIAASKCAVPLAQAYIAQGQQSYPKAETVLLGVIENNPLLTPESEEFKQALFELGQLYYRLNRFEEAIVRLEEYAQRYPQDDKTEQLLFLMGDSYRKSALSLDVPGASGGGAAAATLANPIVGAPTAGAVVGAGGPTTGPTTGPTMDAAEAASARRDRLAKAKALFDRVVEYCRVNPPSRDIDKVYLKLAYFYRADCLYDQREFADAIKLYDAAAFRYQEDPSALAAYVQIVNSYCALGKLDEAKTANERAKWLLRRIPPESFSDGTFAMPKQYWEQWLQWTSTAGMW
jgi:tetratricopeptide (TPR) repeat protein